MGWTLAVDFGTTATAAAVHDGETELLEIDGASRLPSMVLLGSDGELVVGAAAGRQAASAPERVERSPKRRLGDPVVVLGDQPIEPTALVAAVLRHIAAEAIRRQGGTQPEQVVLTHPVSWAGTRLAALREAARLAGLGDVTMLPEPVAAAMHLGDDRIGVGDHVVVYDLGGGTFDAAVLRRTTNGFEPVGIPGGDDQLGGEDFDQLLYEEVGACIADQDPDVWRQLRTSDERSWIRANVALRDDVRAAKEALSSNPEYTLYVGAPADVEVTVTRERFEELVRDSLDRTIDELVATVERAGLRLDDLAAIHLAGGSSRIPLVTRLLSERTGLVPTTWGDPKASVALGAAAKAGGPSPVVLTPPDDTMVEPTVVPVRDTDDLALVAPASTGGWTGRRIGLVGAVASVLLLLIVGLIVTGGDDGSDDPVAAGAATTTTEDEDEDEDEDDADDAAPASEDLEVDFAPRSSETLSSERTWRVDTDTDVLTNEVTLTATGAGPVQLNHIEVIPKEVAADVGNLEFSPAYTEVIQADPVVRYDLTVEPGAPVVLAWSVLLAESVDQDRLEELAAVRDAAEARFFADLTAGLAGSDIDASEVALQADLTTDPTVAPYTDPGGTTNPPSGGTTGPGTGGTTEPERTTTTQKSTTTTQKSTTTTQKSTTTTTAAPTTTTTPITAPGAVSSFLASDPVAMDADGNQIRVTLAWGAPGDNGGDGPSGYVIRCTVMVEASSAGTCGQSTASATARSTTLTTTKPPQASSWVKWEVAAQNSRGVGPFTTAQVRVPDVRGQFSWVAYGLTRVVGLRAGGLAPQDCGRAQYQICAQSVSPGGQTSSGTPIGLSEQG